MKYAVGAILGLFLGAVIAWLGAFALNMLIEPAMLLMEILAVTGSIVGILVAWRSKRKSVQGQR